jgi:hypothetical protein
MFYVVSSVSRQIEITGLLYADELASPEEVGLSLVFETVHRGMTMSDLKNDLPEEATK